MEIKAPKFNIDNLFETHTYTDVVLGSITHSIPVKVPKLMAPYVDHTRKETFTGNTVLHTNRGPMNISFPIEANSLYDAVLNFDFHLNKTVTEMQNQALRQQILSGGGTINNKTKQ